MPIERAIRWYTAGVITTALLFGGLWAWSRLHSASHVPSRISQFGPALDVPISGRIPAAFEHQDAILFGFNELIEYYPQTLVDIVAAVGDRVRIVGLISKPEQQKRVLDLLASRHVSSAKIEFFLWPAVSMWVQDYGPLFLINGEARIIDYTYRHENRDAENLLPTAFAAHYGFKIRTTDLTLDGGNLLSNGRGFCVSTTDLLAQNVARQYDAQKIGEILHREFRFNRWTYLKMLDGEPLGHVDMFMTFTAPNVIVLNKLDPSDDPVNAKILDEHEAVLSGVTTDEGTMRVVRIPMPSHRDGKWRTYTNVVFANGVLLVPQYPDFSPQLDAQALDVYRRLLPAWKVVGIDSSSLISRRGSLHCVSSPLPVFPSRDASGE